jgi:hypothetical protein
MESVTCPHIIHPLIHENVLPVHTLSILSSMKRVTCPHIIHPIIHEKCYLSTHYPSYHPWKQLPVHTLCILSSMKSVTCWHTIHPTIHPSIHPGWYSGGCCWSWRGRPRRKEGRQTTKVSSVVCSILIWLLCFQLSDRLLMPIWTFRRGARILCV